jgi:hypothetical protein
LVRSIVDLDVASLVPGNPGLVEPEIVGVPKTADREQQVRPAKFGRAVGAIEAYQDILTVPRDPDAFCLEAQTYAFAFENLGDRG